MSLFVSSICYSQKWICNIRPYIGGLCLTTQRMEKTKMDENVIYSNGLSFVSNSFADNICFNSEYSLNLLTDIYQFRNKWRVGVGIGFYSGSDNFLKTSTSNVLDGYSGNLKTVNYTVFNNNLWYATTSYSQSDEMGPLPIQVFGVMSKDLNLQFNNRINQIHSISLGLGATRMNPNVNGGFFLTPNYLTTYKRYTDYKMHPFCLFRYEVLFRTKKEKNLFSIALSYQQGFFKVARMEVIDIYNYWSFYSQASVSRGSSFNLTLSRPFNIVLSNKSQTKNKI